MGRHVGGILFCALLLAARCLPVFAADTGDSPAVVSFAADPTGPPVPPVDPDRPGGGNGGTWWPDELPDDFDQVQEETPLVELPEPARPEAVPGVVRARSPRVPGETGAGGWLAIHYVSPLHFNLLLEGRSWSVVTRRPNLQLSDRRGTAGGWKLTAVFGDLRDADSEPLDALLRLNGGTLAAAAAHREPPRAQPDIRLPADGRSARRVLTAGAGEGMGSWVLRWYPQNGTHNDVRLELVSDGVDPGTVRARGWLLWTLHDAP